jgi:hypothetical protein
MMPGYRGIAIIVGILAAVVIILFFLFYGNYSEHKAVPVSKTIGSPVDRFTVELSLDLANSYIDSLYKDKYPAEVGSQNEALMAEYPSVPLSIRLPNGVIIRSGDDVRLVDILSPVTSIFSPVTSILDPHNTKYDTNYDLKFRWRESIISIHDILVLHIVINHHYWTGSTYGTKLTVFQKSFEGLAQQPPIPYADVYLGTRYIGTATPNKNALVLGDYVYTGNNDLLLRSIRYTERHSTELGYEWYLATGNSSKATKLSNELIHEGYRLHNDIYTPLFGTDRNLTDNYLYQGGPNGVYRDCYIEPPIRPVSYQYHSKVCVFGVDFYIWYSKNNDWLVPVLWAIHMLNKYGGPNTKHFNGDSWESPREIARFAETKWIGIGVQSPYDQTVASSVRTAAFDELETILGYRYGDARSMNFSNAATNAIQLAQVKSDGLVSQYDVNSNTTSEYERSNDIGGYYTSWKESFAYLATVSKLKQIFESLFNHPDENGDIKPSNAETTLTSAQALRTYDCYKYKHNCVNTP